MCEHRVKASQLRAAYLEALSGGAASYVQTQQAIAVVRALDAVFGVQGEYDNKPEPYYRSGEHTACALPEAGAACAS